VDAADDETTRVAAAEVAPAGRRAAYEPSPRDLRFEFRHENSMKLSLALLWAVASFSVLSNGPARGERRVEIDGEDGWKIVGTLNLPVAEDDLPLVVLFHTLWGGNRTEYDSLAQVLAAEGVASLRIDLRGHGESVNRGKLERGDVDPDFVFGAWRDVVAAHRFAKTIDGVDADRIGLLGASYSGELVARAGREYEFGKAYVILASGLFSPESVVWMEISGTPWWHLVAEDDPTWAPTMTRLVAERGYAEVTAYETGGHATDLLGSHPELAGELARWFAEKL
jgi:dienelactone hydrolase